MPDGRLIRVDRAEDAPLSPATRLVRGVVPAHLLASHALSPAEATAFTPRDALDWRELDRLLRSGAVRRAGDRYWLDLPAYHAAAERRSRRAAAIALPLSLALAMLVLLLYRR